MASDVEARIARLEQMLPDIGRRIVKLRAVTGQVAQDLYAVAGVRTSNDGQPPANNTFCSGYVAPLSLACSDPQYGAITLTWTTGLSLPVSYGSGTLVTKGWIGCIGPAYAGFSGCAAVGAIALTYLLDSTGTVLNIYYKCSSPFNASTNGCPVADVCGFTSVTTSYAVVNNAVTLTCPTAIADGSVSFNIVSGGFPLSPIWAPATTGNVTVTLPH